MNSALNSHRVQAHIDDLYRSAAVEARRAEMRRANDQARRAQVPQLPTLAHPSVMRRLAARLAH